MSIIQNSYVVVVGNSFSIKDALKAQGFKFEWDYKVWYKLASEQYFNHIAKTIDKNDVSVCFTKDLKEVPKFIKMHKEAEQEAMVSAEPKEEKHRMDGKVFEVKKWFAEMFKNKYNTKLLFRNLEILKVHGETQSAYLVDCKFFGGVACTCGICGAALTNSVSLVTGIGPICAAKLGFPRIKDVAEASVIIEEMHKMSKESGTFQQVWIPKSQIKRVTEK